MALDEDDAGVLFVGSAGVGPVLFFCIKARTSAPACCTTPAAPVAAALT